MPSIKKGNYAPYTDSSTNVYVNSRIYENENAGMPYYIQSLFRELTNHASRYNFVFLQTSVKKKLGKTLTTGRNTLFGGVVFDQFNALRLVPRDGGEAVFHGPGNILPYFKRKDLKYVVTIHDLSFKIFPEQYSFLFRKYYSLAVRKTLTAADIVVAVSDNTKKDIEKYYNVDPQKIRVVYPGINEIFSRGVKYARLINKSYFLSVSTHPRRKNIFGSLEAFSIISAQTKEQYVIVGLMSDAHIQEIKAKVRELGLEGRVTLFGYATEKQLLSLYQHAEFFLYPSYYEGFGFPVLEAMVMKTPVITAKNSSLIELMPTSEWLVDPNNASSIADKMLKIINMPKEEKQVMISKNEEFAKRFGWQKAAQEMELVYELVLKQ